MTVAELISELEKHRPFAKVIFPQHSQYSEVTKVAEMKGLDRGGYVSIPFSPADQVKAGTFIYIGD